MHIQSVAAMTWLNILIGGVTSFVSPPISTIQRQRCRIENIMNTSCDGSLIILHANWPIKQELCSDDSLVNRRGMLSSTIAASMMAAIAIPTNAEAEEEQTILASSSPKVKSLVTLQLSIARGPSKSLQIELFQDAPVQYVDYFNSLAAGKLKAPCASGDGSNIEICEEYEQINVGYKGSQLWRIVPNKRLDFGRVDSMFTSRMPPTITRSIEEQISSIYKPSTRGSVSVKRGGGAFEFTITPSYNPSLDSDKEDLVVVGRVTDESLAFIDDINTNIPVRRDIVKLTDVPPLGSKFARACDFTNPDMTCAQFKPMRKIVVTESTTADI